jgi:hypothetical protein
MSVEATELGASALDQRANGGGDHEPRVDREEQRSEEPESRAGRRRLVHRVAILTVSGVMLASVVAWTAFLIYATAWVIGAVS